MRRLASLGYDVRGIDFEPERGGEFVDVGDLRSLPYPRGHFSRIYSINNALTALDDFGLRLAIGEMSRVLTPYGKLLVTHTSRDWAEEYLKTPGKTVLGPLTEDVSFRPEAGIMTMMRRYATKDGRVLFGRYDVRLPTGAEWFELFAAAGLSLESIQHEPFVTYVMAGKVDVATH